mgnify:CR=1 FL=1
MPRCLCTSSTPYPHHCSLQYILILLVTNITEKERLEYKIISILRSPSIVAGLRLRDNFTFPFQTEVVLIATKLAIPNSVAISFF